jgi:hypothetical protein
VLTASAQSAMRNIALVMGVDRLHIVCNVAESDVQVRDLTRACSDCSVGYVHPIAVLHYDEQSRSRGCVELHLQGCSVGTAITATEHQCRVRGNVGIQRGRVMRRRMIARGSYRHTTALLLQNQDAKEQSPHNRYVAMSITQVYL